MWYLRPEDAGDRQMILSSDRGLGFGLGLLKLLGESLFLCSKRIADMEMTVIVRTEVMKPIEGCERRSFPTV